MLKTQNEAVLQYDSEAAVVRSQFGPINSQISEMLSKLADLGIAPPPEVMLSPMLLPPSPVTREMLAQAIADLQAAINNGDMDAIRAILANEAFGINPDEPSVVPENIETLVTNVKWELSSMTTYLGIRISYLEEITTMYNEYTADLIAKANGKILEYQANQAELSEQSAVTRQVIADIEAAYEEYLY